MLSFFDLIIFGIGLLILLLWLWLFFTGKKNEELFVSLDEKDFPLKDLYFVGYQLIEKIHYTYTTNADRKLRKELSVLYEEKYADYYIRVTYAQKVTLALTVAALAAPLYGIGNSAAIWLVVLMLAGLAYYYFGTTAEKKILKRSEQMLRDFSNVVSKLALLTNAGMIMREAWEEVAYTGESVLYQEMQTTVEEMNNGVSEVDALYNFGTRCIIPEIKKFTSTIVQGVIKGNSELSLMLKEQSKEVWATKKQNVRRQAEKAASKLLIPIFIMFFGILIMIIVPIFANLGL